MNETLTNGRGLNVIVVVSLSSLVSLCLVSGVIWAGNESSVFEGIAYLVAHRWGVVTLLDVYAGALVVAIWMWRSERRIQNWLLWVLALLCLGHLVSLVWLIVRTIQLDPKSDNTIG